MTDKRTNMNREIKTIEEYEQQLMEQDSSAERETDFLEDEDNLNMGELNHLIEEMQDIKPYEERQARKKKRYETQNKPMFSKKLVLPVAILVLSIALFVTLIIDAVMTNGSDSTEKAGDTQQEEIQLKEVVNKKISTLIMDYIGAIEACDMKALEKTVDSMESISQSRLELESEYIEKYENIKMYYVPGVKDKEFVIFVSYENKILNIDTLAPGAMMLYVVPEKNEYRIHTGISQDADIMSYLGKLSENKDIVKFNSDINQKLEEACKQDKNLSAFIEALAPKDTQGGTEQDTTEKDKENKETENKDDQTAGKASDKK